jgi:hypothetical protein
MSTTMAITRPIKSLLARGFAAALALGAASCSTYPAAPAEPAYDTDVLPIFQAHCTRCHDNNLDGGGANHAVFRPGTDGGSGAAGVPHFNVFGPCYPNDGGPLLCDGVAGFGSLIQMRIHLPDTDVFRMPPPPSRRLDDWEMKVIDAWAAENPPICSKSANPDPALQCP